VAVIITTYNHSSFLPEAIDSVLNQTRVPDLLLVVDDGSQDNPEQVVSRYRGVQLMRQANMGLAAARNAGLKAATEADYILFLDADDRLTPWAIEGHLKRFEEAPEAGLVYAAYALFDSETGEVTPVQLREFGEDGYRAMLEINQIGMHGTVLYRRDALLSVGGFDPELRVAEDYDVYLRMTQRYPAASSSMVAAEYRRHGNNMSANNELMLQAVNRVLDKQEAQVRDDPALVAALKRGRRNWARHYLNLQFGQMRQALRSGHLNASLLGRSLRLAAGNPQLLGQAASRRAMESLKRPWRAWQRRNGRTRIGRSTNPVSTDFGYDRGKPLDRHYIERFLASHSADIAGRVLEIGDTSYTERFGGTLVTEANAFHRNAGVPGVKYVGDLAGEHNLPDNAFDCIVLTQTLHLIFDMPRALATLYRVLAPGGVLLVTAPWASPIDRGEWGHTWFWSITPTALRMLLETQFKPGEIEQETFGNTLAASAFLYGLAEHELKQSELDVVDPHCPVIVAARARKTPHSA
jgi:glycosyltransferase involved in cell wall biosynthesis